MVCPYGYDFSQLKAAPIAGLVETALVEKHRWLMNPKSLNQNAYTGN